jgi:hypothetical protein
MDRVKKKAKSLPVLQDDPQAIAETSPLFRHAQLPNSASGLSYLDPNPLWEQCVRFSVQCELQCGLLSR